MIRNLEPSCPKSSRNVVGFSRNTHLNSFGRTSREHQSKNNADIYWDQLNFCTQAEVAIRLHEYLWHNY